jgi:hypothetical protein
MFSLRHNTFRVDTSRRKLRAEPSYPAARAAGSSRFAVIRPFVLSIRSITNSVTGSKLRARGARAGAAPPTSWRAITRFTVLAVAPQIAAAPR